MEFKVFENLDEIKQIIFKDSDKITEDSIKNIDFKHLEKISLNFIRDSRIFMMMNRSSEFFGIMTLSLENKIDFTKDALFDIEIKDNMSIIFNPLHILKDQEFEDILNKLIIELYRIILLHPEMYSDVTAIDENKKHVALDMSSDMNIYDLFKSDLIRSRSYNMDINKKFMGLDNSVKILEGLYNTSKFKSDFKKEINENGSFLEYYKNVYENLPDDNQSSNHSSQKSSYSTPNNPTGNKSHQWEKQNISSTSSLQEFVKKLLESNENLWQGRGNVSGEFETILKKLKKKPQKIWGQIVTNSICSIPYKHRKTRSRPNRRQPENYKIRGELPDKKRHVVIAIDTSGSMTDNVLSEVISELYAVLSKMQNLCFTIIECDSEIQRVYDVNEIRDLKFNITGRGGTCFSPVIEYLNSNLKYRNSTLIYITDGYGESKIPKPLNKVVWMVISNNENDPYLSLKENYGIKTVLKIDSKIW